jgi:acyl-CoA synthetase (AMP-forming)/AMP-acid ligase II/acyl carrier protein
MITHRALCNHILAMQAASPLTESDRMLQKYSISFDVAALEILAPLLVGARLVLAPPGAHRDTAYLLKLIEQQEITLIDLVPSHLELMMEEKEFGSCKSLRRITCGGEALTLDLQERCFNLLDVELKNVYGPTEATIGATIWACKPTTRSRVVPIGRPLANTQAYVLDLNRNPVPVGVTGELYIGGDGLARGYLNQPDVTAERFIPDHLNGKSGSRLYRTGDLARYRADGDLEYLGRVDQQVKVRGFRIELEEIEKVLQQHPSVRSSAVVVKPDAQGSAQLVAYVVPIADKPEMWPSIGEYFLYDDLMYYAMTHDERRNQSYRVAINQLVKGKTVLDIGTGADAILTRLCLEAGAVHVYAIEMLEHSYKSATKLIAELGLNDKVTLIHGDATRVQLPERVDVCVSELLGMIGSSEGVIPIINDARRFLKPDGIMIPQRSITKIAVVQLPKELALRPRFTELSAPYAEKIFETVGHQFDVRVCIKNFPNENVLSDSQIFEDLDFAGYVEPKQSSKITLTITKDARMDGLLLWLCLHTVEGEVIDVLSEPYVWLPVFCPVSYPGLAVSKGDVIQATCWSWPSDNNLTPDYRIKGVVTRRHGDAFEFDYHSLHHQESPQKNSFYELLFNGDPSEKVALSLPEATPKGLKGHLERYLPEYMVPSSFVFLKSLPLTSNGKIDRRQLPNANPERAQLEGSYVAPRTDIERTISSIWQELLGVARVGVQDNFFDLGGHSLLMVRMRNKLQEAFSIQPTIIDLFRYPTISSLTKYLGQEKNETSALRSARDRADHRKAVSVGERSTTRSIQE